MKRVLFAMAFVTLSAAGVASCGSGGSSLDPNKRIADLTPDEQKQLCDETAVAQGGYGRTVTCPDGSIATTDANQASCLGGVNGIRQYCPSLTVSDGLNCANSQGRDFCSFATAPECKAARDCLASIPRG
jgi:hypothetical protein